MRHGKIVISALAGVLAGALLEDRIKAAAARIKGLFVKTPPMQGPTSTVEERKDEAEKDGAEKD